MPSSPSEANPSRSVRPVRGTRVLITGAAGFLGSHLARALTERGAIVGAMSRSRSRLEALHPELAIERIECDLTQRDEVRARIDEFAPEVIFHYASEPDAEESFDHTRRCIQTNLLATVNLLEAFAGSGGLLVYGDSAKVYGNAPWPDPASAFDRQMEPNSSYAVTKAAGWMMSRCHSALHGFKTVSLRPTLIYGPGQPRNLIRYVIERACAGDETITLSGGDQTRDPLFIDDAIDAAVRVLERGDALSGQAITIGGGQEMSVLEIARLIVELCGSSTAVRPGPDIARPTEVWRIASDNRKAEQSLQWFVNTPFREGLARTIRDHLGECPATLSSTTRRRTT